MRTAPTPQQVRAAREEAGMTQAQAAELVDLNSAVRWSEYERGVRSMEWARWQLFLLLVNQHPKASLVKRRVPA
jgi:DNA-binding transcriptional regulator YiaG